MQIPTPTRHYSCPFFFVTCIKEKREEIQHATLTIDWKPWSISTHSKVRQIFQVFTSGYVMFYA